LSTYSAGLGLPPPATRLEIGQRDTGEARQQQQSGRAVFADHEYRRFCRHAPMQRYSVFALAREAIRGHAGWDRAWASPSRSPATTW
jgi:hypothetical protein